MHIKKTWESCIDKDIEKMFNTVWDYVSLNYDLDDCPYLYMDKSKSVNTLGLFTWDNRSKESCITLNKLFVRHKDRVLNTIIHEFAHYVAWKKYDAHGHDRRWQQIGNQIGMHFGEEILPFCSNDDPVLTEARELKPKKLKNKRSYEIVCESCKHVFRYKKQRVWFRNKQYVDDTRCTCPYCQGHRFEVKVK